MQLELIIWNDPASHKGGGWSQEKTSLGTYTMYTAGWVTDENEREVTIHSTIGEPEIYGHDTVIPRGCIVARKVLRRWTRLTPGCLGKKSTRGTS